MCCIFGIGMLPEHQMRNPAIFQELLKKFMKENVYGGRTAAGLSINSAKKVAVFKKPMASTELVKTKEYENFVDEHLSVEKTISILGHCRLKTKGSEMDNVNNHPIVRENVVGVHNGMIGNDDRLFEIWSKAFPRNGRVDSEIIFALVDYFSKRCQIHVAISRAAKAMTGSFACSMVHRVHPHAVWIFRRQAPVTVFFFEEYGMLMWSTSRLNITNAIKGFDFGQVKEIEVEPHSGIGIDLYRSLMHRFKVPQYNQNTIK